MAFEGDEQIEVAFETLFEKLDNIGMELETDDGDGNDVRPISRREWLIQVRRHFDSAASRYYDWTDDSWEA